ncbi:MAG: alkylhydroperoxidase, partial [Gammaproteobacteria bacterium]|nr:alkylhydroperoxidase [Gammaproteobacteria bacterium]
MIAWIETIDPEDAGPELDAAYRLARTPHGTVDNVMRAHSLRPHTMEGHLALYRSVLHHDGNRLPLWFLEAVATYTSLVNRCEYSLTHHFDNMRRLLADEPRARRIRDALGAGRPEDAFTGKELAMMRYAGKLTAEVGSMRRADVEACRAAGADDGEILEVNQV